jgi:O-antigen/teichoic acid export membrane protein
VASPRIAQWYSEGATRAIARLMSKILLLDLAVGLGLFLMLAWFARPIFHVLISAEVAQFSDLGIWIAVAAGLYFVECHLGVAVTSMNILKEQVPVQMVKLASALILAAVLIPFYGVYGAVWSVIISSAVGAVLFAGMFRQGLSRRQRANEDAIRADLCNRDA